MGNKFAARLGVGVAATALLAGAGMGVASADTPTLTGEIMVDPTTAAVGDTVNVTTTLNGTQGDSNGGQFIVTTRSASAAYLSGTQVGGTKGCASTDDGTTLTVTCEMDVHNSSKSIGLQFKLKQVPATFTFTGSNGYGDAAAPVSATVKAPGLFGTGSLGNLFGSS